MVGRSALRWGAAAAALLLVVALALVVWARPGGAVDGLLPTGGTPPGEMGLDPSTALNPVSPTEAGGLATSGFSLADIDPLSGSVMAGHVAHPLTSQYAAMTDLLAADAMLVDTANLAEQAQLAQQRERAERRRQGLSVERADDPGAPEEWELGTLDGCLAERNAGQRARHEVVTAYERMCQDALEDGVELVVNSAYRSPQRQYQLYRDAVQRYGSEQAARRWVAWSDGQQCSSRHCAGTALDIGLSGNPGAREWMHDPVGCWSADGGLRMGAQSCGAGETTVKRANLYGFVIPLDHEPWHIEIGVPMVSDVAGATCDPPANMPVPDMVASIFLCEMRSAGFSEDEARRIAAEAVTVARCESQFNADAVVFGGRYTHTPHPETGLRYTAAGVMQFTRATAEQWIDGGYDNVHDPVSNIRAAAQLYLHERDQGNRGWGRWACATAADGFQDASVLPGWPGGPSELPSWAWEYVEGM